MRGLENMKIFRKMRTKTKNVDGKTCKNACTTMEEHKHVFRGIWFYTRDDTGGG